MIFFVVHKLNFTRLINHLLFLSGANIENVHPLDLENSIKDL
ncbi:hypothetical protein M082_5502 [Bacteroides fragilis str. 3725 D9 ii]|nr:hypothetical protein M088_4528 [Bacteroides ovatus str. 3725 D1 iv]KDS14716.1 hypothetical protein M082_5502 [Bacteroides fragilis str. 3725 D9 ii]